MERDGDVVRCSHCTQRHTGFHLCDAIRKVQPYGAHVLLVVLPRATKSAGGIIVTNDEVLGREDRGYLLRCGPQVPIEVQGEVHSIVRFNPYEVRMVIDVDGAHTTNSAHAKAGAHAIIPYDAIIGVDE